MPRSRDLLSLQEAMDWLGVSRATIDRWRRQKQLPYIKIGKEVLVDRHKLDAWVRLHGHDPHEAAPVAEAAPSSPNVVTVGYQSGAALLWSTLVVKQLGLFEEELNAARPNGRIRVQWVNAPNGMELVEELIAGRVQIASVGDYPIIASRALSRILPRFDPLLIGFAGKTRGGSGISLVAPAGGGYGPLPSSLTERGISTVANSSASYRLREWMKGAGLNGDPVHYRRMSDCLSGLVEGRIGAAMLWEPYLTWAQTLGAGYPLASDGAGDDYLTGLLTDGGWAARHEDVVIAYLRAHLKAHAFIRAEPDRAARLVHEGSGFPVEVVYRVLANIRWDASIYMRDLLTLKRLGEGQSELLPGASGAGGLDSANRYLQEAASSLRLPLLPDSGQVGEWSREAIY
ncbi:helix-turn-helix domain-containing protein [Cohnella sp. GCM10027633]|uniref:helix-turn-helix domain-containing protein n=1 Tax=unclassified Cohnella TaxID=2636738 RepID=UPI003645261F